MSAIKDLNPQQVWRNFDLLTQVPRPSGHLEKVTNFLLDWAKERNLEAFVDPARNIIIRKPATPGMEDRKPVILQAHMDMVPQKAPESSHNFETDPIETHIEDGWVYANNTTLGADDGLGVAAIMGVLEAKDLKHGPIEGLITADEETGMFGANDLPAGELNGQILINLDSETWGEVVIGSAGGIDVNATLDYKEAETDPGDVAVKVTLQGLKGGHSGLQIHLGRGNANKMMCRFVYEAISEFEARLATWHGGNMRNAIPFKAEAVLTLPKENLAALKEAVGEWEEEFNEEFKLIENPISFTCEEVETPKYELPEEIQDNLVSAIYACHDGVVRMIPAIPEVVETSSNFAIVDIEGGKAEFKILPRSSSEPMKKYVTTMIDRALSMAGMKVETSGSYQGWDPDTDSELLKLIEKTHRDLFGKDAHVQVDHAGLECSIILSKYPGLDVVSVGPTIESPHTSTERCKIDTIEPFWRLLPKVLEDTPKK